MLWVIINRIVDDYLVPRACRVHTLETHCPGERLPHLSGLDEVGLLEDFWKISGGMLLVKDETNTANGSRLSEKVAQPALFVLARADGVLEP
jgi:hypothetical protein